MQTLHWILRMWSDMKTFFGACTQKQQLNNKRLHSARRALKKLVVQWQAAALCLWNSLLLLKRKAPRLPLLRGYLLSLMLALACNDT